MKLSIFIQAEMESLIPEEQIENVDVFFDFKTIALIVIIIVLFIIALTFFQQLKKANSRIKELNQKTNFSSFESAKQSRDQAEIVSLREKNEELKRQLTDVKQIPKTERVNVIEEIKEEKQELLEEGPIVQNLMIEKPEVLFLPSPFEDSKFSAEDVSKERTPFSLYKIKLSSSKSKGDLTLLEDADLSRALNSPDHYLEKACVYENAFNINATSIEVIEEGEVKLDNQDWLVISKVKIKFI